MSNGDSGIAFHKLQEAMDRYGLDDDARDKLLSLVYMALYEFMRILFRNKKK